FNGTDFAFTEGFTKGRRLESGRRTHFAHSERIAIRLEASGRLGKRSKSSPVPAAPHRSANERKDSRRTSRGREVSVNPNGSERSASAGRKRSPTGSPRRPG